MTLPLFLALVSFGAAFLQSAIGFGAAIVMINLLPLYLTPARSILLAQTTCIAFSLLIIARYRRFVRRDVLLPALAPSLLCAVAATAFSRGLDTRAMTLLLGILFLLLSAYFLRYAGRIHIAPSPKTGMLTGALSGLMNGMFSAGGPPIVLYMSPALPDKREYLATIQIFFLTSNIASFLVRIATGMVSSDDLSAIILCAISGLAGSATALAVTGKVRGALLTRLIALFIGINGLSMIHRAMA